MKIDKEYPATHSMSTAWYVADEDGNVGIIDYNENGPVPWGIEQTCIENLVFGHEEGDSPSSYLPIDLNEKQICELIENPRSPIDEKEWYFDTIVQIDLAQEKDFIALAKNPDAKLRQCLSKKYGLYIIDCYKSFVGKRDYTYSRPLKNSSLRKMIDAKMIIKVYSQKDFNISDKWENDHPVYEYDFDKAPFYIYAQPYWNKLLAERINIPENPVKIDQLPVALRKRVHRVPFKFNTCEHFQIAEYATCSCTHNDNDTIVDGCRYSLLPKTSGGEAYFLVDLHEINFFPYCSEKNKYHCEYCTNNCTQCYEHVFTDRPTVMIIVSPYSKFDYGDMETSDIIIKNSIMLPFLPMIPRPFGIWPLIEDAKKVIKTNELETLYLRNSHYIEDMLRRYNPQVVIADAKALKALEKKYSLKNNAIDVCGIKYPFFRKADIKSNRAEIERLVSLPYQGKEFPRMISIEEMQEITKKNND